MARTEGMQNNSGHPVVAQRVSRQSPEKYSFYSSFQEMPNRLEEGKAVFSANSHFCYDEKHHDDDNPLQATDSTPGEAVCETNWETQQSVLQPSHECVAVSPPSYGSANEEKKSTRASPVEPKPCQRWQIRSNSTTSIFASGTISHPDMCHILYSISFAIYLQVLQDGEKEPTDAKTLDQQQQRYNDFLAGWRCELRIVAGSNHQLRMSTRDKTPEENKLYSSPMQLMPFINDYISLVYQAGDFSPESFITSLVLFNRFLVMGKVRLLPMNWRNIFATSLLVSQKLVDDVSMRLAQFVDLVCPWVKAAEMCQMEIMFVTCLKFELRVTPRLFVQYYFDLRDLCSCDHYPTWRPNDPMTISEAKRLELRDERAPFQMRRAHDDCNYTTPMRSFTLQ